MRFSCPLRVCLVICGVAVGAGSFALETGINPNPFFSANIKGDFTAVGSGTRVVGGPPQIDNFPLLVQAVPLGAAVVRAYANWSYLSSGSNLVGESQITINGVGVQGALTGSASPDLVWGKAGATSYTADVTGLVIGNGAYVIGSAIDDPVGLGAFAEGISIVLVWEHASQPLRQINLWTGYTSTTSGAADAALTFGQGPFVAGSDAHLFLNALDGQPQFTDEFYINQQLASGTFAGVAGNAWQGDLGPGAAGTNLYDHADGNASTFFQGGENGFVFNTYGHTNGSPGYTDAIGHTFVAMSFDAVPEPGTLAVAFAVIAVFAARRRKSRRS